jgi:uncharacterized protein
MTSKILERPQRIGRISHIAFYPVKGLGMIELSSAVITPQGIEGDRQFMIVKREADNNGIHNFVTQRLGRDEKEYRADGHPLLALIKPELEGGKLLLRSGSENPIYILNYLDCGRVLNVGIWGNVVRAIDQGDLLAQWLSDHLNMGVRLVKAEGPFQRNVSTKWAQNTGTLSFQDGYQLHWFMQESVAELSKKAGERINWRRFRPNIVAEDGEPRAEHLIYQGEINGMSFIQPKPCDRCPVTTVDPQTAQIGKEPLKTLATYKLWRKDGELKVIFGENAVPSGRVAISVGDEIMMIAKRDPPLRYGGPGI